MADMHTPLLPCPYCGGSKTQTNTKAKSYFVKKQAERAGKDTSNYIVRCTACGAKGPLCHSAGDAIAAWNRRAPSQDAETIKALREFAEWVETWVSNPVGAYSVDALNGLFAMTRDRLAALAGSAS